MKRRLPCVSQRDDGAHFDSASPAGRHRTGNAAVGMPWLSLLQWPAMAVTILAGWLTASESERRRRWGFTLYLVSNVVWTVWAWHAHAWALIVLQIFLATVNVRGVRKNDEEAPT